MTFSECRVNIFLIVCALCFFSSPQSELIAERSTPVEAGTSLEVTENISGMVPLKHGLK